MSAAPVKSAPTGIWRRSHQPRFHLCAALFILLVAAFVATGAGWVRAIVFAFAVAATVFLAAIARMFARSEAASIRSRARDEDQGRWGILWTGVSVSAVVLIALGMELHAGKSGGVFEIALAAICLLLSWFFMNTMFAVHYAHAYYGDDAQKRRRGGLLFPGRDKDPDYWDFTYFAMVVGMTCQVSDVQVTDRRLRRITLVHGVIAFFFNVIIIALSVNVVAGRV